MQNITFDNANDKWAPDAEPLTVANAELMRPPEMPLPNPRLRPKRDNSPFHDNFFPDGHLGRLLGGLMVQYFIKMEHRLGWPRMGVCDRLLDPYPNETVASHQWGVAILVMTITRDPEFQAEQPQFDTKKAMEMAMIHDLPELVVGDITPADDVTSASKHQGERLAMDWVLGKLPSAIGDSLGQLYAAYEDRQCAESKFVKDCDRLDFLITALMKELQGGPDLNEFFTNNRKQGPLDFKINRDLLQVLEAARNTLIETNRLVGHKPLVS